MTSDTTDPASSRATIRPGIIRPGFIRKVFQGVAARHDLLQVLKRHHEHPGWPHDEEVAALAAGEWAEIQPCLHDEMLDAVPLLFRGDGISAVSEFLTAKITSVFFRMAIDGRERCFHGYCNLGEAGSVTRMRAAIAERERLPVKAMTRDERIEHIWTITHRDYRGYAGERWAEHLRGKRTILVYGGVRGTVLKLLDNLTDAEITAKLPVHLRGLAQAA